MFFVFYPGTKSCLCVGAVCQRRSRMHGVEKHHEQVARPNVSRPYENGADWSRAREFGRSFYKELKANGLGHRQIVEISNELLARLRLLPWGKALVDPPGDSFQGRGVSTEALFSFWGGLDGKGSLQDPLQQTVEATA